MKKTDIKVIIGSFVAFLVFGWVIWVLSGQTMRGYGIERLQPVFLTITVTWLLVVTAVWVLSFKFKAIKDYIWSIQAVKDFNELQPIYKLCISLFLFAFLLSTLATIFKAIA